MKPRQVTQTPLHLWPQLGGHPTLKFKLLKQEPHRGLLLHLQARHWEWQQWRKLPVLQHLPLQVSQTDTVMETPAETRWGAHLAAKGPYKALLERSFCFKGSLQAWIQLQGTDLSSSPLAALVSPGASRMATPKHPDLKLPGESKLRFFFFLVSYVLLIFLFPVAYLAKVLAISVKLFFGLKKDHLKQARDQTGSIYSGETIVTFLTE